MKKEQVLAKLRSCGLVAVVRAKDADDAMRIAEACIEGGCAGIELTYTTPGVNAIIEKMVKHLSLKLRQLIKKKHTSRRKAHLPRLWIPAASCKCRLSNSVMRRPEWSFLHNRIFLV